MTTLLAKLHVDAEGRVTGQVPRTVPPGDYVAPLTIAEGAGKGIVKTADPPSIGRCTTVARGQPACRCDEKISTVTMDAERLVLLEDGPRRHAVARRSLPSRSARWPADA